MSYDLEEFLEEYDDITEQVKIADQELFPMRLRQWWSLLNKEDAFIAEHIKWLTKRSEADEIFQALHKYENGTFNSPTLTIHTDKIERLTAYAVLFTKLNEGKMKLLDYAYQYFPDRSSKTTFNKFIANMFNPFASDLRRYIKRNFGKPASGISLFDDTLPITVPASNRFVTINHNSPQFGEIGDLLKSIEQDIRGINSIDQETKEVALSELRATKSILDASAVRDDVIQNFLIPSLKWIAVKFAEYGVSGLIGKLVATIRLFFGL